MERQEMDSPQREGVKDFSLFKPKLRSMQVHSATYSCSVELYQQWYTLADFQSNWNFRGVFSTNVSYKSLVGSMQLRWHGTLYFLASLVQWEITRGPILRFYAGFFLYIIRQKKTEKLRWAGRGGGGDIMFLEGCDGWGEGYSGKIGSWQQCSSFRVRRSSEGCSIAQKGAAYPEGAAQLLRRRVAQKGFSVAQKGLAQLRRVQLSSQGAAQLLECSIAFRSRVKRSSRGAAQPSGKINAPGGPSLGLKGSIFVSGYSLIFNFWGMNEKQRSCHGWGARSAPFGMLISPKRRVRAAHGRARAAKIHQFLNIYQIAAFSIET